MEAVYLKETPIKLPVSIDWYGNPLQVSFSFILQVTGDLLTFGAHFPADCHALGEADQFVDGLWKASVVELFMYEIDSPRYIEINLSPSGAYWLAKFSDYRVRDSEIKILPIIERTLSDDGGVIVSFKTGLKELAGGKFIIAQTAILSFNGVAQSLYLSRKFSQHQTAFQTLNIEPDFHQRLLGEQTHNFS